MSFVMAVGLSLLISISTALPIIPAVADSNGVNVCCAPQHVSYNPGVASKYHAPISSMGLLAIEGTFKGVSSSNLGSSSSAAANVSSQGVPVGLTRFINDSSYAPQSETTIAVDPRLPQLSSLVFVCNPRKKVGFFVHFTWNPFEPYRPELFHQFADLP